jgi:CDP-diacylglycerol--serine O-phosphatidyltransferase
LLALVIVGALLAERIGIGWATSTAAGRAWIVRHRLFHPNTISYVRMPMGLISILLWVAGWHVASVLWFAAWMISDLTDGTIARTCDLQTESGKWLDPLSDKLMYFPPLVYFALVGGAGHPLHHVWGWVVTLIALDAVGQGSRFFVQKKAANSFGKAKTAFITILLTLAALSQMKELGSLPFATPHLFKMLAISCTVLAFLSLYCKAIPDNWYANSLTLCNFLCGAAAIWQVAAGHPVRAFILVFLGQFFDLFDGRMARKFGSTRYGAVFDDIADGTSFGLAIGCLIVDQLDRTPLAWCIGLLYFFCVVYRLIRFLKPTVKLPPGIFQGYPSPGGAMLAGASVLMFCNEEKMHFPEIGAILVLVASFLMISSIPYRHFGQRIWPGLPNGMKLLLFVFVLAMANVGIADKDYRLAFLCLCMGLNLAYAAFGVDWRRKVAVEPPEDPG